MFCGRRAFRRLPLQRLQCSSKESFGVYPCRAFTQGSSSCSGVACSNKTVHVIRLDVSQYGLKGEGEINSSLAALTRLAYLDLRDNNFNFGGLAIPEFVGSFKKLRYLDLSRANFGGKVPPQLGNLSTLQHGIDLSENQLTGEIPKEIGALSLLRILNLSGNHISGITPEEIGNLWSLEALDLSHNGLSGPIPSSMANLSNLSMLNLSYNDLSGRIPTGSQLQTLTDPSIYAGNADLCGPPLSTECSQGNPFVSILSKHRHEIDRGAYLCAVLGFAYGLYVVSGNLLFSATARKAYFQFTDSKLDELRAVVEIKLNRFKAGRCQSMEARRVSSQNSITCYDYELEFGSPAPGD
ncbi:probable inactive leucine-rich repeat receptor-like protein kinase At1g66830 [Miscanthus floridulus]|uniref:probable inactive leucine-rich repeat receptor-like protein kinase At1g66830 n=1 Tax=Miscanthus floridulus TaxID=154761 RepID=UPI00345B456B